MPARRAFSTSKGAQRLAKSLQKELDYERENYHSLEDSETFLSESGFEYSEDDAGLNCYLTKEVEGRKVTVHFQARQPVPEEEY
jgi:hypothetical protein